MAWKCTIVKETNSKSNVLNKSKRDWDNSGRRLGSTDYSVKEIGFKSKIKLIDGLEQTLDWTRSHMDLIERNIDKHANEY